MSEVSLSIGGRSYKVACAQGEEAHVARLGAAIDAKLQSMPSTSAQDAQNLLFAALLLADELHEARNAVTGAQEGLRTELDELRQAEAALREELDAARAARTELREQLAALTQERDGLRGELDETHSAQVPAASPFADPELPSALERFAELLETCADKLEGRPASP